jgi:hypothetical protein
LRLDDDGGCGDACATMSGDDDASGATKCWSQARPYPSSLPHGDENGAPSPSCEKPLHRKAHGDGRSDRAQPLDQPSAPKGLPAATVVLHWPALTRGGGLVADAELDTAARRAQLHEAEEAPLRCCASLSQQRATSSAQSTPARAACLQALAAAVAAGTAALLMEHDPCAAVCLVVAAPVDEGGGGAVGRGRICVRSFRRRRCWSRRRKNCTRSPRIRECSHVLAVSRDASGARVGVQRRRSSVQQRH